MSNLETTPLADSLARMYGVGIRGNDVLHRFSFWTGNEADNVPVGDRLPRSRGLLATISPEAPQFALQRLERARDFVSLLLGGDQNMWANVDFAGAFGTAISGRPVVPHITRSSAPTTTRLEAVETSQKLLPGLENVVFHPRGTAHGELAKSGALAWLSELRSAGYHVYAKTGTLAEKRGVPSTSRLVLAIVKPGKDDQQTGIVLSFVVERARVGLAAELLGDFLMQNREALKAHLP